MKNVLMQKISWANTTMRKQHDSMGKDQIILKDGLTGLYNQICFNEFLDREKKRCKRSGDPSFLMLVDVSAFPNASERIGLAKSIMSVFAEVTRDTDIKGWYKDTFVMGIIFTEMNDKDATSKLVLKRIANKCLWRLKSTLDIEKFSLIQISWQSLKDERISEIQK